MPPKAPTVPRAVPAIFERPARGRLCASTNAMRAPARWALTSISVVQANGRGSIVQAAQKAGVDATEGSVVGHVEVEEQAQTRGGEAVAEALVRGHAASGMPTHADHQVRLAA